MAVIFQISVANFMYRVLSITYQDKGEVSSSVPSTVMPYGLGVNLLH